MTAVRLARGATGRPKILKFAGCYHGHVDALLVAAGSGVATLGLPGSAGVTEGAVADTVVVPYNDDAALDAAFAALRRRARGGARRAGRRQHGPGPARPTASSTRLRDRCTDAGALLVFDEVITGFRVGPGRRAGPLRHHARPLDLRQGRRRRPPARRGRRPRRRHGRARAARPRVPGRHAVAGTRSRPRPGSRCSAQLDDDAYADARGQGRRASPTACAPRARAGRAAQVTQVGTLAGLFFADRRRSRDYDDAQAADHARYARFFHAHARPRRVPRRRAATRRCS